MSVLAILIPLFVREVHNRTFKVRPPKREKILRPAGESLRERIETLSDDLCIGLGLALLGPVVLVAAFLPLFAWQASVPISKALILLALTLGVSVSGSYWVTRKARSLRNARFGFEGERFVGQVLSGLSAKDCIAFHDIRLDGAENLDHVLITPWSVFAIETKMRRQQRSKKEGQADHEVNFDGTRLHYPFCTDGRGLQQVSRVAKWLSAYLSEALAEEIPVMPVLALPGWYVRRTGPSDVIVLNAKQLRSLTRFNPQRKAAYTPQQIKRLCFALSQRCHCQ